MQWRVTTALAALCWLFLLLEHHPVTPQQQGDILVAPGNMTRGIGQARLNLTCEIRTENVIVQIDGKFAGFPELNDTVLKQQGIIVNPQTHVGSGTNKISTVQFTLELIEVNNNTRINCVGSNTNENDTLSSPDAFITIIGPPLSPSLQYSAIDEHMLHMFWEEPYTADGFPITSYFLRVVDSYQTNQTVLTDTQLGPEDRAINLTRVDAASCTNLTIEVRAQNEFGNSSADRVYGAFPSGPGDFQEPPNIAVTFSNERSPILHFNFIFPSLCPFNNATYVIEIEDEAQRVVYTDGPTPQHWMDGGSLISRNPKPRVIGLESNAQYTLNITVWTGVGHTSSVSSFNTSQTTPLAIPSDFDLTKVVAASIGGMVGVILMLIAITMCIIYVTRRTRKRKRECFRTTEYTNGSVHNHGRNRKLDSRGMPMVDNPIYERDPIYEEINLNFLSSEDGYMSIISPAAANSSDVMLEKCSLQDKANDDYTRMDSAGTLRGQLCVSGAGAAATGTPNEVACFSSVVDEEGASAQCSGQEKQDLEDLEGRYIMS